MGSRPSNYRNRANLSATYNLLKYFFGISYNFCISFNVFQFCYITKSLRGYDYIGGGGGEDGGHIQKF